MSTKTAFHLNPEDPETVFEVLALLGQGSYGSVYKALDKRDGKLVAIKVLEVGDGTQGGPDLQKEIDILRDCNSEFVVQYKGTFYKDGNIWIVMEYCDAGSVSDLMTICDRTLSEEQIAIILRMALQGLQYLHENKKIHRDIKSGNLLLNHDGDVKLADFGVSAEIVSTLARRTVIGTPYWMAPEVLQSIPYNEKADIWSLGITAIELAAGQPPHSDVHPMRAIFLIPNSDSPTLPNPSAFSPAFNDFLAQCLHKSPEKRPSATQLLDTHPLIVNAKDKSLIQQLVMECITQIEEYREQATEEQDARHEDTPSSTASGGTLRAAISPRVMGSTGTLVAGLSAHAIQQQQQQQQQYQQQTYQSTLSSPSQTLTPNNKMTSPSTPHHIPPLSPSATPISPRRRHDSIDNADATLIIKSPSSSLMSVNSNAHPALLRITSSSSSTPSAAASPNHSNNTLTSSASEHSSLGEPLHFGSLRTELNRRGRGSINASSLHGSKHIYSRASPAPSPGPAVLPTSAFNYAHAPVQKYGAPQPHAQRARGHHRRVVSHDQLTRAIERQEPEWLIQARAAEAARKQGIPMVQTPVAGDTPSSISISIHTDDDPTPRAITHRQQNSHDFLTAPQPKITANNTIDYVDILHKDSTKRLSLRDLETALKELTDVYQHDRETLDIAYQAGKDTLKRLMSTTNINVIREKSTTSTPRETTPTSNIDT